jgi:hypothetical protein
MGFDYGNAEAWEPRTGNLLGPGEHLVEILEADDDTVESSGNPQIVVRVGNADGAITDWLVITQKTIAKVVAIFDAAKVARPQADEFDPATGRIKQSAIDRLIGKRVLVVVREQTEMYQGSQQTRTRVQGYLGADRGSDAPIDSRGLPSVPEPTPQPAAAGAVSDDRIPF